MYILFEELFDYDQYHVAIIANSYNRQTLIDLIPYEELKVTHKIDESKTIFKMIPYNDLDRTLILIKYEINSQKKVEVTA